MPYPQFALNVRVSKNCLSVASLFDVFPEVKPRYLQVCQSTAGHGWECGQRCRP